jgi:hypothetical protein
MRRDAFTLMEILLTSLILANIGLAIFLSLRTGIYLSERDEDFFGTMQGVRIFLRMLERDLRSILYNNDILSFNGGNNTIQFYTLKDNQILEVIYSLEGGILKKSGKRVVSKEDGKFKFTKGNVLEFISYVKEIAFSYYDSEKDSWLDNWDSQQLPSVVKVTLKVEFDKRSFLFSKFVKIPVGTKVPIDTFKQDRI